MVEVAIEQATHVSCDLTLIGDFNQDMLSERKSQSIRNTMNLFGLNQIIDTPRRVTPHTSTLIELILESDSLDCVEKGTIPPLPFCSDYHSVYFQTNFVSTKPTAILGKCSNMRMQILICIDRSYENVIGISTINLLMNS